MLTRFHKVLVGLLVAQLVLLAIILSGGRDAGVRPPQPLLAGFDAAKVTRVQVTGQGSGAAAIDLAKRDAGWVLTSAYDYPADAMKVDAVLSSLAKMAAAEPMATSAARHKQLHVADDDFSRKLVVTAGGKDTTVYIGAAAGPGRAAVRIGGDDRVFAVSGLSAGGAGLAPASWIEPAYERVPKDELVKITVQAGDHRAELSRQPASGPTAGSGSGVAAPAAWSVALDGAPVTLGVGEALDTNNIARLVTAISTVSVTAPADPKRDASHPLATITLERGVAGGLTPAPIVLDILDGAGDATHVWVHDRAKPTAALVDAGSLDLPMHAGRDTLVKKPPPALPQGTPMPAPEQ